MVVPKIFSFGSWDTDHPADRHPGERIDAQFDAHANAIRTLEARIDAIVRADGKLHADVIPFSPSRQVAAPRSGFSHAGSTNVATLTDAAAENWAEVSMEWAEHMPDTIPGNILATNAITGDHWSSRWWANRAALSAAHGTTAVQKLKHFPFDGFTTIFPLLDELASGPIVPVLSVSQLSIVVDGVSQEPGIDFVLAAAGASVQFTTAPAADAKNFATYFLQGVTDSGGLVVGGTASLSTRVVAAASAIGADIAAIETSGYAAAGDGGGALYKRGSASTTGGFQSADGTWWELAETIIHPQMFGADGTGVVDATAAFNLAFQYIREKQIYTPQGVGRMYSLDGSGGYFRIDGSINATLMWAGHNWGMRNIFIQAYGTGKTVLDLTGASWGFMENVYIWGNQSSPPTIGILWAPTFDSSLGSGYRPCAEWVCKNVVVDGYFKKAGVYFYGQEESLHSNCRYMNRFVPSGADEGWAAVFDGSNTKGATSDYAPIATGLQSFTLNRFNACAFQKPYGLTGPALFLHDLSNHKFVSCYVTTANGHAVEWNIGGYICSEIELDLQAETTGMANLIKFTASSAMAGIIHGLNVRCWGNYVGTQLFTINTLTGLTLNDFKLHVYRWLGGTPGSGIWGTSKTLVTIHNGEMVVPTFADANDPTTYAAYSGTLSDIAGKFTWRYAISSLDNTTISRAVFNTRLQSVEDSVAAGPRLELDRLRSVPAINDNIGELTFSGRNSAAAQVHYAFFRGSIINPSSIAAEGRIIMYITTANAVAEAWRYDSNGLGVGPTANVAITPAAHIKLRAYAKASLPTLAPAGQMIYVTDDAGGSTPAFSDGTNWRRVADRAVIA